MRNRVEIQTCRLCVGKGVVVFFGGDGFVEGELGRMPSGVYVSTSKLRTGSKRSPC